MDKIIFNGGFPTLVVFYCTNPKNKSEMIKDENGDLLNGKVVGMSFVGIEKISFNFATAELVTPTKTQDELLKESCLSKHQLYDYLGNSTTGNYGYAIEILRFLDLNLNINEFKVAATGKPIKRVPQNMYDVTFTYNEDEKGEHVLYATMVSVRPQWIQKIRSREKTIEIRKSILGHLLKQFKQNKRRTDD